MAALKSHAFFSGVDFERIMDQDSPVLAVFHQLEEQENSFDDMPEDLFLSDEFAENCRNITSKNQFFARGEPLTTVKEVENEDSLQSQGILRTSATRPTRQVSNTVLPAIEEEEKKAPRHMSNVTDEEPTLERKRISSDTSSSEDKMARKFSKSTSKIPKLDLTPDEEKEERKILLEGFVKKRSTLFFYKKRFLELSMHQDTPRLLYYYANKRKVRNRIELTKHSKAVVTEAGKFEILGDHETLYFKEPGSRINVDEWVDAINDAVARIKFNANRRH